MPCPGWISRTLSSTRLLRSRVSSRSSVTPGSGIRARAHHAVGGHVGQLLGVGPCQSSGREAPPRRGRQRAGLRSAKLRECPVTSCNQPTCGLRAAPGPSALERRAESRVVRNRPGPGPRRARLKHHGRSGGWSGRTASFYRWPPRLFPQVVTQGPIPGLYFRLVRAPPLHLAPLDGGAPCKVEAPGVVNWAEWSPAGDQLVIVVNLARNPGHPTTRKLVMPPASCVAYLTVSTVRAGSRAVITCLCMTLTRASSASSLPGTTTRLNHAGRRMVRGVVFVSNGLDGVTTATGGLVFGPCLQRADVLSNW